MNSRISLALLLGLGATMAVLLGCGTAPAAQTAESPAVVQRRFPTHQRATGQMLR